MLAILLLPSAFGQTWHAATLTGSAANPEFNNKLPYDSVNQEMLYFQTATPAPSIYSGVIYGYKVTGTSTGTLAVRVNNGIVADNCAQSGAPYDTQNPLSGHPGGYFWFDSTHGKAELTDQLCSTQFMGYTAFYVAATQTMGTRLAASPFSTGGTFNDTSAVNNIDVDWISGYGKAVYCCYSGAGSTAKMIEFDGVSTWTDITGSVNFTNGPPQPFTMSANMSDGTYLWILGGCQSVNSDPCDGGTNQNDLYRYNPTAKTFAKMSPVGGTKPPSTNSGWPFAYYDSLRQSIVWYAATNDLWVYSIPANTWTETTTTGGFTMTATNHADGNMAQYDPSTDTGVFLYGATGAAVIYHLKMPSVTYSSLLTIQEAIYPGGFAGSTRTNESFCQGAAIPDAAAITSTSQLTLVAGTATPVHGQFLTRGVWPSGNIKWVQVCAEIASLTGGGTGTVTLQNGGSGNF